MSTFKETQAIVCGTPREDGSSNWKMEKLRVREIGENELVVRIVASGVCHTDLLAGSVPSAKGGRYPRVLGHEGESSRTRFIYLFLSSFLRVYIDVKVIRSWYCR
jgi:hypothetical protein